MLLYYLKKVKCCFNFGYNKIKTEKNKFRIRLSFDIWLLSGSVRLTGLDIPNLMVNEDLTV